jgi:hypothetical protein
MEKEEELEVLQQEYPEGKKGVEGKEEFVDMVAMMEEKVKYDKFEDHK